MTLFYRMEKQSTTDFVKIISESEERLVKKLRRAKKGRKLLGVCAGLANFFGVDVIFVRLIWVLVCLFPPVSTLTAIFVYIVLGYVIPEETDYIDV